MQIQRSRLEDHLSFSFENNIVAWKTGALLSGDWSKLNVEFNHNTYWHPPGKFKFDKLSWDDWRAKGMDKDSRIADPGFKDAAMGDFHMTGDSQKAMAGFVPFELSGFGPRP
jgi:hypothetical protein